MHIVFGYVMPWQVPMLKILRYFKLNVYYLHVIAKTDIKKNEIATKLKKNNIYPLPLELEKKISPNPGLKILFNDPDEFSYKKNIKLIPDANLKKYSNLFSIKEKDTKKLRLLIQDFMCQRHIYVSCPLRIWSTLYPREKIIYVSFNFKCFYMPDTGHDIFKIIIPVDLLNYFIKIINFKKIFLLFSSFKNKSNEKRKKQISNEQNFERLEKKSAAFIIHKGLIYGGSKKAEQGHILFEKLLYYSDDKNSCLNKHNILHLDYENFLSPDENLHWVNLKKIKVSNAKIFFKTLLASTKTCYLIRSWSTFLGWLFCIKQYNIYLKYCEVIKRFKNLKIALIDYDVLCPKTLILAMEKNNIKTIATQERFIHTFCNSYSYVMVDTYYAASEFAANVMKNSKYNDIKNFIPAGLYRSDYLSLYKKKNIPEEIAKAKENGKKILIALGYTTPDYWFESYTLVESCWSSHINFLESIIRLSQNLKDTLVILRYKNLDWTNNKYFKKILKKIDDCENIIISNNYKEPFYAYKLCANADLIIAKHTSLADECLSHAIPVLFHEYGHNYTQIISDVFNYLSSELMCHNFDELLERSKSLLFNNSSKLKEEIASLNKTIYHMKEKGNIKNKIIMHLENLINESNL
mgnify:CR=1 FL=1